MDLNKKTINVTETSYKEGRYVVKDQESKSYSFFEKKRDGGITKALDTFQSLGVKVGSIVNINYSTNEKDGRTYKNIMFFSKPDSSEEVTIEPFTTPKEAEIREKEKWDNVARGKIRHGFALEAFKKGTPLTDELVKELDTWVEYVMSGELNNKEDKVLESIQF